MFKALEDAVFLSYFQFNIGQGFDDHQWRQILFFRLLEDSSQVFGSRLHL